MLLLEERELQSNMSHFSLSYSGCILILSLRKLKVESFCMASHAFFESHFGFVDSGGLRG